MELRPEEGEDGARKQLVGTCDLDKGALVEQASSEI